MWGSNIFKKSIIFFNASIYSLSNFKSTKEIQQIFDNFLKKVPEYGNLKTIIYDDYTVQEGIFNFADEIGADLIALGTHGRQGIMHFLTGSIAENIVNSAKKNILTIKIK